jgi:hypothetical protein
LKGAHLTLGQLDKTLPVETGGENNPNDKIERGSFMYISTGGTNTGAARFKLYDGAAAKLPNAVPYIALMGVKDFQAGMAGNIGQAPEADGIEKGTKATGDALTFLDVTNVENAQPFTGPRITGISVVQPAEYQTTAFETKIGSTVISYYVGQPLTISNNGKLTPFEDGCNIVGYVTAIPKTRWINNLGASADGARISGGNASVIEFSTAWIPCAAKASGDDANIGSALSVKGASVKADVKAPAPAPAGAQANAPAPAGAKPADPKTLVK